MWSGFLGQIAVSAAFKNLPMENEIWNRNITAPCLLTYQWIKNVRTWYALTHSPHCPVDHRSNDPKQRYYCLFPCPLTCTIQMAVWNNGTLFVFDHPTCLPTFPETMDIHEDLKQESNPPFPPFLVRHTNENLKLKYCKCPSFLAFLCTIEMKICDCPLKVQYSILENCSNYEH